MPTVIDEEKLAKQVEIAKQKAKRYGEIAELGEQYHRKLMGLLAEAPVATHRGETPSDDLGCRDECAKLIGLFHEVHAKVFVGAKIQEQRTDPEHWRKPNRRDAEVSIEVGSLADLLAKLS